MATSSPVPRPPLANAFQQLFPHCELTPFAAHKRLMAPISSIEPSFLSLHSPDEILLRSMILKTENHHTHAVRAHLMATERDTEKRKKVQCAQGR
jgi:hypothetical protein